MENAEEFKPKASKTRQRLIGFAWWMGLSTLLFLLVFCYRYFDDLAGARSGTFTRRLIQEVTGVYFGTLLLLPIIACARRFRFEGTNWRRFVSFHLLLMIGFSVAHTTCLLWSRRLIYWLVGFSQYQFGILPIRYLMEFANDALFYILTVIVVYLFDHYRQSRDRELKTAQLEAQLAQAQLQALQAQIHPHFLFNALNTISSVIYEDVAAADTMIARLSDFLRHSLTTSDRQEVRLADELRFLNLYLDIMRPRLDERLQVDFAIESATDDALVPKLILQPLVENSIKHAADPQSGAVSIAVRVARENGSLLIEVQDEGAGATTPTRKPAGNGVGLTNTAERLKRLYGEAHEFRVQQAQAGGTLVRLKMPYRTLHAPAESAS